MDGLAIEHRRDDILALAYKNGFVTVKGLAEVLNVSEPTVRRDLHKINQEGLLQLTHGGAKVVENADHSFLSKLTRNVEAKKIVASLAAEYVQNGDQIFLDSGTTCFQMTSFMRAKRALSVVVHSIRTAQELKSPNTKILIPGGLYRPEKMDTIGPMAIESLERLRGYTAFIGSDGIGMDFGLTSVDIDSAHLQKVVIKNAKQTFLLIDSSKFDQPALYKIADFNEISAVVTEQKPSDEWLEFLEKNNINVIYPNIEE